mmetsp:Transcript_35045/g.79922  ORF Transcript_35045/g.79922 Transcript_35045/m.79922 type:complete len:221 (-) Transcript_35045:1227-1889(-)
MQRRQPYWPSRACPIMCAVLCQNTFLPSSVLKSSSSSLQLASRGRNVSHKAPSTLAMHVRPAKLLLMSWAMLRGVVLNAMPARVEPSGRVTSMGVPASALTSYSFICALWISSKILILCGMYSAEDADGPDTATALLSLPLATTAPAPAPPAAGAAAAGAAEAEGAAPAGAPRRACRYATSSSRGTVSWLDVLRSFTPTLPLAISSSPKMTANGMLLLEA